MHRAGARTFGLLLTTAASTLLLSAPARSAGSVVSIGPNAIKIEFQHPGYTAKPFAIWQNRKYRVCQGKITINTGIECVNIDSQWVTLSNQITPGTTYRIKVMCFCRPDQKFAVAQPMNILEIEHHHSEPAPPTPPQIVRLRSVKTGQCLYPQGLLIYSAPCGPISIMRFAVEDVANGHQIRHLVSGRCIHGGFPQPNPMVALAMCGKVGTRIQIRNNNNGTYRIHIPTTEDQVFGYPVVKGGGGCVRPSPVQGGQARKQPCHWELWLHEDQFYFDPA